LEIISNEELRVKRENVQKINYNKGGLWEENEIEVALNYPVYSADTVNCPHLSPKYIVRTFRHEGTYFDTIYADCPRVIIAKNEGGCNSTGLCLDCILEQFKQE